MDKFAAAVSNLWNALLSLGKVVFYSRWRTSDIPWIERLRDELIILGNGPSLKGFLEEKITFLDGKDLVCVNYAVESPYFAELKPRYYVAIDPAIFRGESVERAFGNLARKTDWEMHLFVPYRYRKMTGWREALEGNPHIRVHLINITPVEGSDFICFPLYWRRLGMPRPHNVLIPSLMCGLWMGYKTIHTAGVEHTWHLQLWVDDQNRLMINDRHFYDDSDPAARRHGHFRMDTILRSLATVFAGYQTIQRFSKRLGTRIYNLTEGSFIDAFERKRL